MVYVKQSAQLLAHSKVFKNISCCYGLNCVPHPKNSYVKALSPVPQNVTVFEGKVIKEVIQAVSCIYNPNTLGGQGRRIMRSGVQDQPGQHGETPFY